MNLKITTRFALSPTDFMQLNHVRIALFNQLLAASAKGVFLLRIDDIDFTHATHEFINEIVHDLQWLRLEWQEGPISGGVHAPYLQSERLDIYRRFYTTLEQLGLVYPCFCRDEQLKMTHKIQVANGQVPHYLGTCRNLSHDEIQRRIAVGERPALRFAIPRGQAFEFHDLLKGSRRINHDDVEDFVIQNRDGAFTAIFCDAIDDALMEVTQVLRDESELTNSLSQLLLLRSLKLREPQYGHMPVVSGFGHGQFSRNIPELREQGFLPLALLNYLARLSFRYHTDACLSLTELAANFSLLDINHTAAHYDEAQLLHWQKQAVANLGIDDFCRWGKVEEIPEAKRRDFVHTIQAHVVFPREVQFWYDVIFGDHLIYTIAQEDELRDAGRQFFICVAQVLAKEFSFDAVIYALQKLGLRGNKLFGPLRLALTSAEQGPDLSKIFMLLTKERVMQRLEKAKELC